MTLDKQREERVRGAFAALTDTAPLGVEFDELNDDRSASLVVASPDHRSGWLGAAVAAVAVLVLVGGIAWLSPSPSRETGAAATAPIISSTSLVWSRIPHSEASFGDEYEQYMASVTVGGPGLVAVGEATSYVRQSGTWIGGAAVWTSLDGLAWSRVPHDEGLFEKAIMNDVTPGGPGLVAVGRDVRNAVVWTSPDGISWSRVPHDDAVFGGELGSDPFFRANMNSVTVGGPGLVAVGSDWSLDGGSDAAVWTSVDGVTWSRVAHDEAVFGGETDGYGRSMASVTAGGPGLVAVGWDVGHAAVWTSLDGSTWSRVPRDEVVFADGSGLNSVTVGGPGLVAVGKAQNAAAIWTSPDGIAWSRVPHDEAIFGGRAGTSVDWSISSVTAGTGGLVAVGSDPDGKSAAVWTSVDGLTWSRVHHDDTVFGVTPLTPSLHMASVTAGGPGFVAVGEQNVSPMPGFRISDAAVWVAVP